MKKTILFSLLLVAFTHAHSQLPGTELLQKKAITLKRFLDKNHYQPVTWNDSASIMLYNKWLGDLDEEKLFFTASDIAALQNLRLKLDDELNGEGGWKFYQLSMKAYKRGVQKADSLVKIVLAKPIDITKTEELNWPFTSYATNDVELGLRWSKYLKWQLLQSLADELTEKEIAMEEKLPPDFAKLEERLRKEIRERELKYTQSLLSDPATFDTDMQEAYLNAIAWCYDPHTQYMNLSAKKEFETEMSASAYTAGVDIDVTEKGDKAVGFLQPGGSAWRSGQLHKGDVLVKIKTGKLEKNIADLSPAQLEALLNGNSEGDIELTIRTVAGEMKTVKLMKEKISDEESIVKSYVLHTTGNIGYINLPGFYSREEESETADINYDGCANDVSKEIVKLKKDSLAGLVLDLRYNGGGSMWEAMQLAGIFIDIGPVASVKDRDGKSSFLKDPNRGTIYDGPLLVLVNGFSASASEFVSAVLQDYNRAIIVGSTTYGKGTAQMVLPMDTLKPNPDATYEDFLKVTQRKFYRVNGGTTQWKGVVPDILLPDMYGMDAYKEKANASALKPDENKKGFYQPLAAAPIPKLKAASEQRVAASNYFSMVSTLARNFEKNKTGRTVPLQWAGYVAHYKKVLDMMKQMEAAEAKVSTTMHVRNNSFDAERIRQSADRQRSNNEVYLEHIQSDPVLEEACNIIMNLNGNK